NHFEYAIQVYVSLDLLTTGYFTGNYNNGYNRIAIGNIAGLIGGNADTQGAYNVVFMKNLIHKLAISCFDYERYILYEIHKNDLTLYFCSDFNRGTRRRRYEWESVKDAPNTILLDKTNFPEEMNIHFAAEHDGEFDKVFITPKMIKKKQKQFNKMRFEPKYLIEINEAANFQTKFMRDLALCRNNTSFLGGLQILLEGMLPNGRHELEDYKSQMNLINNKITDTLAFFIALSRVYDYYKSEKKKKENRFKKNEFAIVSLRNMKYYNCGRKEYLMSDCRSKKQDKGYNKGKKFSKERFSKDRSRKEFNKKRNGYTDKRGRTWKSKEDYKK
ncbi:15555_t:CDS:2, partial [Gigaspora rosea]